MAKPPMISILWVLDMSLSFEEKVFSESDALAVL